MTTGAGPAGTRSTAPGARPGWARHAGVVCAYAVFFTWVWARPLVAGGYLAGTDLFDYYLPIFFSPVTLWSHFELSGLPALADSQNATFYPLNVLFARALPSWTAYIVSAYVLAASFTYAYVYNRTRSVTASAFAGLAYGLSEAMMERLEHLTIVHTIVWLPLLVLAIDRLRGSWHPGWVAAGALAVGSGFLAGHTQPAIYITYACALYALVGGLVSRAGRGYFLATATIFVVGGLLAGVSALPLLEASREAVRQSVGFGQFVSHSNTPAQMLSALIPQIVHEGREAPTYVGLGAILFALAAIRHVRENWAVAFWWVTTLVAFCAGAGDATPVAGWLYELPFYDSFRVVARHLVFAAFGLAVLSGFGVAAVLQGRPSRLAITATALGVVAALAAGVAAIAGWPGRFAIEGMGPAEEGLWSGALGAHLLLGLVTAGTAVALAFVTRPARLGGLLVIVLAVDLLHALPYPVQRSGVQAPIVPASALEPSVHAVELRRLLQPGAYRFLAPAGVTVDPVVPGAFARLWEIPVAGAYGAILTQRYAALAAMDTSGAVQPQVLADDSVALDLLAVKYIGMRRRASAGADVFEARGVPWATTPLDLAVGPRECGQRYPRRATYALPPDVTVARVLMVAALRCSDDVVQGTSVGALAIVAADGGRQVAPLHAGVEIADASVAAQQAQRRARHGPADVFAAPGGADGRSLMTFELTAPVRGAHLEFTLDGTAGWLQIDRLTVVDTAGNPVPVTAPDVLVFNRARWNVTRAFSTSRSTDRGVDEDVPGEEDLLLLENRRVLPRAWVAREVVPLDARQMAIAVHHSHLPDGRRFDPAAMALVDAGDLPPFTYPDGAADVRVEAIAGGRIQLRVSTAADGMLVLSESYYPGWQARVGDAQVPVHRVDLSLQGVVVPRGTHAVTFEFKPRSLRLGAAASAVAAGALLVLTAAAVWPRLRATARRGRRRQQTMSDTSSAT